MTQKWYVTLCHLKMYPHTKFEIPTSKNIGDMDRTRSGPDRRTVRLLYASQSSFGGKKKSNPKDHVCYNLVSLVIPYRDPLEGFFFPTLPVLIDSYILTLKAPNTIAADDKFCDTFPNFRQN